MIYVGLGGDVSQIIFIPFRFAETLQRRYIYIYILDCSLQMFSPDLRTQIETYTDDRKPNRTGNSSCSVVLEITT